MAGNQSSLKTNTKMNWKNIFSYVPWIIFSLASSISYSQQQLKGKVLNEEKEPIAFASVGIKGKKAGIIADSSGHFRLSLPGFIKPNDTVIISSIGFKSVRLPVSEAIEQSEFILAGTPRDMPGVTLSSFLNMNTIGTTSEDFTFFRGWYDRKTGGEIGRILIVPHRKYKVERIFFKADNKCDTCWMRLHIRKVKGDSPGDELLTENIILPFSQLNFKDQPVFDLSDYNIVLSEKRVFIGFEVLNCINTESKTFSLCFIGTEYGDYFYKTYSNSPWEKGDLFNIDIRMFLRY